VGITFTWYYVGRNQWVGFAFALACLGAISNPTGRPPHHALEFRNTGHVCDGRGGVDHGERGAVAAYPSNPLPIVITDLGMPYVDRRTVASSIKAPARTTIVTLLTGWGERRVQWCRCE
jgi:hypothetical protein